MRRLEEIPVSRRRVVEDEQTEMEHLVRAQKFKGGKILSLVRESLDIMVYVRQGIQYVDARKFGALPSYGRPSKIVYAE